MTALLDVGAVSYSVGERKLIDELSLAVAGGEIVALVGPNGAGKTTLVRLIGGEIEPDSGSIAVGGTDLRSLGAIEAARLRSVLPQQTTIRFPFTALDVVLMGRYPVPTDRHTDRAVSVEVMDRTDTRHLADAFYPTLSGGEKARVSLARILAQEAPLLVLDEPAAALDVRHQELVMRLLSQTVKGGSGCLVVLHDLNLAAAHADRLALLHQGRLVAMGSVPDVLDADLLSHVYRQPMSVHPHPERDGFLVLVRGEA
jgi:iron complex transport system ATP-binding protein